MEGLELGGAISNKASQIQVLLQACSRASWADFSHLHIDWLSPTCDRLQLVPTAAARCFGCPVFGMTGGDKRAGELSRRPKLKGQFSLLDVFDLADSGAQGQPPHFAPLLEHAVFKLGHGLSELVTTRKLTFPDLSGYSHLKLLAVEECMVQLPILTAKLPAGLQELIICARDASRVLVVWGVLPSTTAVRVVQIGSPAYDECMRPYFSSLCALSTLGGDANKGCPTFGPANVLRVGTAHVQIFFQSTCRLSLT
ncbi:hypothetical protein WJX72_000734 [[Myrmecia] bisecta]|uniref:Uncharacterized protein n=1 Tax=[Myrmecia] bisecta TaxID=41462 RepID=A0AAW1QPJ6_9CHLO